MISSLRYWTFGENFCLLEGRKIFSCQHLDLKTCKNFENRSTDKVFMAKMNFEKGFSIVKNHGRDVIIFLQNFKTHGILLYTLEIIIKCQKILS